MSKIKINKQDIITIILARGGSKGLKNKNLKKLNGKPLIYYPINAAKNSKYIGNIIVSTDSKKIASVAKKFGAVVPFIRPKKLSGSFATTEKTLQNALINYEKLIGKKFKICVFLTATDIFRKVYWIDKCIEYLHKNKKIESVFFGYKTSKNYWEYKNRKWIRLKKWMRVYSSRQIRKTIVREDTGLACASRSELWRKGRRIGDKVKIFTNDDAFTHIDIHTIEDLKLAEAALKIRNKK
jgi:CMP-N,N'-diacetyllegionaminic acid synthase